MLIRTYHPRAAKARAAELTGCTARVATQSDLIDLLAAGVPIIDVAKDE